MSKTEWIEGLNASTIEYCDHQRTMEADPGCFGIASPLKIGANYRDLTLIYLATEVAFASFFHPGAFFLPPLNEPPAMAPRSQQFHRLQAAAAQ